MVSQRSQKSLSLSAWLEQKKNSHKCKLNVGSMGRNEEAVFLRLGIRWSALRGAGDVNSHSWFLWENQIHYKDPSLCCSQTCDGLCRKKESILSVLLCVSFLLIYMQNRDFHELGKKLTDSRMLCYSWYKCTYKNKNAPQGAICASANSSKCTTCILGKTGLCKVSLDG